MIEAMREHFDLVFLVLILLLATDWWAYSRFRKHVATHDTSGLGAETATWSRVRSLLYRRAYAKSNDRRLSMLGDTVLAVRIAYGVWIVLLLTVMFFKP